MPDTTTQKYKLINLANLTTFAEDALKTFATKDELNAAKAAAIKGIKLNGENVAATDGVVNLTAATGTANGTVAINGTDVAVKGLGALAYKENIELADLGTDTAKKIDDTAAAVEKLNGDAKTEGSVANTVASEVTKIVGGASADFDTLKEMEDWLTGHESEAAGMNTAITKNTKDIANAFAQMGVAADAAAPAEGKDIVSRLTAVEGGLANVGENLTGFVRTEDIVAVTDEEIHALLNPTPAG